MAGKSFRGYSSKDVTEEDVDALAEKYLSQVESIVEEESADQGTMQSAGVTDEEAFKLEEDLLDPSDFEEDLPDASDYKKEYAEESDQEDNIAGLSDDKDDQLADPYYEDDIPDVSDYKDDVPESTGAYSDTGETGVNEDNYLPFTISVADADGLAVSILDKGTRLPAQAKMAFSAPYKTPSAVKVRLYAGEGMFAKDNILVDNIKLSGIKEYNGGMTKIIMQIRVERNGDLITDLLDEGSVSRKHDKAELDFAKCKAALADQDDQISPKDAEIRESFFLMQRARYTYATAARLLKKNKKYIDKDTADLIKERMKELKAVTKNQDIQGLTAAQKTSIKTLISKIVSLF